MLHQQPVNVLKVTEDDDGGLGDRKGCDREEREEKQGQEGRKKRDGRGEEDGRARSGA